MSVSGTDGVGDIYLPYPLCPYGEMNLVEHGGLKETREQVSFPREILSQDLAVAPCGSGRLQKRTQLLEC